MESTRQHLLRVTDIVGEIEGRLRSLRLQAQKAERYKRYKAELKDLDLWSSAQRYLGHLAEEKSLGEEILAVRDSHETQSTSLEAGEAGADAERLAVTEEVAELATAKDELYALSNKAQLGMQRSDHHDAEATELSNRVEAGRNEITELRARAAIQAAADGSEGEYEAQARLQEERRATLAVARRELEAAQAEISAAQASIARREAERAGATQRRDDLAARVAGVAGEEATAGERL